MARELPGSVVNSMRVLGLIVATSGVITVLIWMMRDDVILGWAEGNPSAQDLLAQGGIELLRESPIVPGFVALSIVAFVGFALLAFTLRPDSTMGEVTVKMIVLGLGMGPSIPLYTLAIQNSVEPRDLGVATASGHTTVTATPRLLSSIAAASEKARTAIFDAE